MALLKCNVSVLPLIFKIGVIGLERLRESLGFAFESGDILFPHFMPRFLENVVPEDHKISACPGKQNIAICLISWKIAEMDWFAIFERRLKHEKFQVYKIIMDKHNGPLSEKDYSEDEKRAFKLGSVYSYFKDNYAEGAACNRVVDLMNRLMQCDLEKKDFEGYDLRTQAQIAWHVNREDYNIVVRGEGQRVGAIEKYKIVDNRPVFKIGRLSYSRLS